MRRHRVIIITVGLVTVLLVPLAAADGQDDAGSGRDAGDSPSDALPLAPGTYNATLVAPDDTADYYSFHVEKGQEIRFSLAAGSEVAPIHLVGPSGRRYGLDFDGDHAGRFLAHVTGTWYLRMGVSNSSFWRIVPNLSSRDYRFSFSLETPEHVLIETGQDRWHTLELAWDDQADVRVYTWKARVVNDTRPLSTMDYVEHRAEREGQLRMNGYYASHLASTSWSRSVGVEPGPVPERDITILDRRWDAGWSLLRATYRNVSATVRAVTYTTIHDTPMVFAVASDRELRNASAGGDDVVAWNEYNGADAQVLTPAASVTGSRERIEPVDGLFYGFFTPWEWRGSREGPDGNERTFGSGDYEFLIDPARGNWTFRMEPTVGATGWTVRNYLDGVHVPALGVAPEDLAEPE